MARSKEKQKEWYLQNKERLKKKYEDNRDDILEKAKKRYNPEKKSEYNKKYGEEYKEEIAEYNKSYYSANKEEFYEYGKKYREENKEKIKNYQKEYNQNPENIINRRKKVKEKYDNDNCFKFSLLFRNNLNGALKKNGLVKSKKSEEILGCSFLEFREFLETQFETWMTWDNHGKYNGELNYGWDIDHILPLDSVSTEEDIYKLCHYTNFQPLCSYTNRHIKRHLIKDDKCLFCEKEIINRKFCSDSCKWKYHYHNNK